jgi:hypothetical protein
VMEKLVAGDVLCLRDGSYGPDDQVSVTGRRGTAAKRIVVRAENSGRAVFDGKFNIVDPDYWTISGIRFTNPTPTNTDRRIVVLIGGTGWSFENNEISDGRYAGLLVGKSTSHGAPMHYTIRGNRIHDTDAVNHYHNPGADSRGGLIERNLYYNAGTENLKVGWGGTGGCTGSNASTFGVGEVRVAYNTMDNAKRGGIIVAERGGQYPIVIERNLLSRQPSHLVRLDGVEGCLLGDKISVRDNAGVKAPKFYEDFAHVKGETVVGNYHSATVDPGYDASYRPAASLQAYGHLAG